MLIAQPLSAPPALSRRDARALGLSVLAHALLAAAILWVGALPRALDAPPPPAVAVDLISPAQFEALRPAPVAPAPDSPATLDSVPLDAAPAAADAPAAESAETPAGPVKATQFYAAALLADPANRQVARALPTLGADDRIMQLCNIEGLEQIRRAAPDFAPDTLVPYAMGEVSLAHQMLVAASGAFRSRRKWYAVALSCTVAADYSHVEAFEFTLGAEIPREQWDAHDLTEAEAAE